MPRLKPNSGFAPIIIILLLLAVTFGAYLLGTQKNIFQKPSPVPTPTATPDPTANWKTYSVLTDMPTKAIIDLRYRLPVPLVPNWVNAGHYYQSIILPGNSTIAVILTGENKPFDMRWERFSEMVDLAGYTSKQIRFLNLPAIEFSGTTTPGVQELNILGQAQDSLRGIVVKLDDKTNLEILHYQDKSYLEVTKKTADFSSDEVIFDQILSTFNFELDNTAHDTCPVNGYVDCMPKAGGSPSPLCSKNYLDWAKTNCPNFKGAAY